MRWNSSVSASSWMRPYLRNGNADAVGRRELAEQVVAPREQPLEELERPGQLPAELVDPLLRPGSASARSASISFGGRFQIRLNQSRKTSSSAARASSRGKSGGSGCSSSR